MNRILRLELATHRDLGSLTIGDYRAVLDKKSRKKPEDFMEAFSGQSIGDARGLATKLSRALASAERLSTLCQEKALGSVSVSRIREAIETGIDCIKTYVPQALEGVSALDATRFDAHSPNADPAQCPDAISLAISNREIAFARLLEIADYFERAEPQSFIAPTLRDVVRRGRLTFFELASELIPEEKLRIEYLVRAGISRQPDGTA